MVQLQNGSHFIHLLRDSDHMTCHMTSSWTIHKSSWTTCSWTIHDFLCIHELYCAFMKSSWIFMHSSKVHELDPWTWTFYQSSWTVLFMNYISWTFHELVFSIFAWTLFMNTFRVPNLCLWTFTGAICISWEKPVFPVNWSSFMNHWAFQQYNSFNNITNFHIYIQVCKTQRFNHGFRTIFLKYS